MAKKKAMLMHRLFLGLLTRKRQCQFSVAVAEASAMPDYSRTDSTVGSTRARPAPRDTPASLAGTSRAVSPRRLQSTERPAAA